MTAHPAAVIVRPEAMNVPELPPAVAWSRRVRRVGGLIQAAFAAFWLIRASLAIGGRPGDVLIAVSGVTVIGVFTAGLLLLGTAAAGFHDLARLRAASPARPDAARRADQPESAR